MNRLRYEPDEGVDNRDLLLHQRNVAQVRCCTSISGVIGSDQAIAVRHSLNELLPLPTRASRTVPEHEWDAPTFIAIIDVEAIHGNLRHRGSPWRMLNV